MRAPRMPMARNRIPLSLVLLGLAVWAPATLAASGGMGTMLDEPVAKQLHAGETIRGTTHARAEDVYQIVVPAGQSAHLALQASAHLEVALTDESNQPLIEWQNEGAFTIAPGDATAAYRLAVRPAYAKQPSAEYTLNFEDVRQGTPSEAINFRARVLDGRANRLLLASDVQNAIEVGREGLQLARTAPAADDLLLSTLGSNLANMQIVFGSYSEATGNLEEALRRARHVSAQNPQTAEALRLLGFASTYVENFARSEELLQQSLVMTKAIFGEQDPRVADVIHNIGLMRQRRGEIERALTAVNEAIIIDEKAVAADDPAMIRLLAAKADVYIDLDDQFDRAQPILEAILPLAEKRLGPEHMLIAHMLQNLGILARRHNRFDEALTYYWRAEKIRERRLGRRHMATATLLINIGNVYKSQGDPAHALASYLPALDVIQEMLGPYHAWTLMTISNIAYAYAGLGDVPHAVEFLARENQGVEHTTALNVMIGSERERLAYVQKYSAMLDQVITLNTLVAPGDQAARDLAALVLLERKGRVQDETANSMQTLRGHLQAQDQGLLDQLRTTTEELARVALGSPGVIGEARRTQISRLEEKREKLEIQVAARSAGAYKPSTLLTLDAVRSALPADAALVEFARFTPFDNYFGTMKWDGTAHYAAYVIAPGRPVAARDLGDAASIDAEVGAFRAALRDPTRKDVRELGRKLDHTLFEPLRAEAPHAQRFLVSPDGQLNLVPMEALVNPLGRYLIADYSISYLTSGRDLLRIQNVVPSRQLPVIVANPSFGVSTGFTLASSLGSDHSRLSGSDADDSSAVYFAPLRGTAQEGQRIRGLFPEALLLTGVDASKPAMQRLAGPRILHIATHGFFLDDTGPTVNGSSHTDSQRGIHSGIQVDNPLLRSGLALAGANLSGEGRDNGVLTALEASNLDLWGTKLVTLSACDTGNGQVRNGEGTYGLRRAFVLAGAESIVTSLWAVSDYATRELMTGYYAGLQRGEGRGEALRESKLAMLSRRNRAHPYFWASFIQFGAWTSLEDR